MVVLSSAIFASISISAFASLVCVPVGITSSAVGINICPISAWIKKYKSIIKKWKKKHNKIVLLGKDKLNSVEVLIFRAWLDSYISHDETVSVNKQINKFQSYIWIM